MNINKHFVKLIINPIENQRILDLAELDRMLLNLSKICYISKIHIVSNNLGYLSDLYFDLLFNILKLHCQSLDVNTSFERINKSLINNFDIINVYYNFNNTYDNNKHIFNTIKAGNESGKIINIKTYDTDCLLDVDKVIDLLNKMQIKSWELIPNHDNVEGLDYTKTEDLIQKFYNQNSKMKFSFLNKLQIDGILTLNNYNQFILHITPENKFAIQNFNKNNNLDKFLIIKNIEEIKNKLVEMEILQDNFCKNCTSKIKCMANYFKNYTYTGKSCCGLKNLLERNK